MFSLSGVPNETTSLQFHMVDLDVPSYNHGGESVQYIGKLTVPCGALTNYTPPSPPKWQPFIPVHRYSLRQQPQRAWYGDVYEKISRITEPS